MLISDVNKFRALNFRGRGRLRKYFNNENFPIYGIWIPIYCCLQCMYTNCLLDLPTLLGDFCKLDNSHTTHWFASFSTLVTLYVATTVSALKVTRTSLLYTGAFTCRYLDSDFKIQNLKEHSSDTSRTQRELLGSAGLKLVIPVTVPSSELKSSHNTHS